MRPRGNLNYKSFQRKCKNKFLLTALSSCHQVIKKKKETQPHKSMTIANVRKKHVRCWFQAQLYIIFPLY